MTNPMAAGGLAGRLARRLFATVFALQAITAFAQSNAIESVTSGTQGGSTQLRIQLKSPPAGQPASFSVSNPPRVALDFPETTNAAGQSSFDLPQGDVRNVAIVQSGNRSRVVLNLKRPLSYTTAIEGNSVLVTLSAPAATAGEQRAATAYSFVQGASGGTTHAVRDLDFRRGKDGEGRVVVEL